ncbi:FecR domain-containing protein [Pseudomonas tremae]|uniref:Regulatory protein n=2 Tax=Pseudomonas syringae group TaxID=136849 RepID=A0AB37QS60_9PSED|nr:MULTISPECIES: FecR family protein [Pseudomonas syringae group]RMS03835.1 Regulatory protein [Pseudomonas coronafaciens pv. garcae]RMS41530.1 Regulatory protein [Pseudomonas coronafaciens pv. garcae]RMU88877.1 Regulatory protein [Pseudomonas coronafaciens pv. coronafaciens]
MSDTREPSELMITEAASWLALMHDEPVSAADRTAFEQWRQADPAHELALSRMQSLWGSFDELSDPPKRAALRQTFVSAGPKPTSRIVRAVALIGVLVCGWMGAEQLPVWMADQHTEVGERRQFALADGSQVQLNSGSALNVKFDGRQRVVELLQGELWVEVAKDVQRPFVVRTDQGTITALGTRFLVQRGEEGTTVSVLESAIAAQANTADVVNVAIGQQALLKDGRVQVPHPLDNQDPAAWTRGLLKVDDRPLSEVLRALAVYRHGMLRFDAKALEGLRVSGVFRLDDTDAALATLADNLPITVERFTDLLVIVKPTNR